MSSINCFIKLHLFQRTNYANEKEKEKEIAWNSITTKYLKRKLDWLGRCDIYTEQKINNNNNDLRCVTKPLMIR